MQEMVIRRMLLVLMLLATGPMECGRPLSHRQHKLAIIRVLCFWTICSRWETHMSATIIRSTGQHNVHATCILWILTRITSPMTALCGALAPVNKSTPSSAPWTGKHGARKRRTTSTFGDRKNLGFDSSYFLFRLKALSSWVVFGFQKPLIELVDMKTLQSCAVYAGMPFCVVAPRQLAKWKRPWRRVRRWKKI